MTRAATQFVESVVETAEDGARMAARQTRGRPKAKKLLHVLRDAKRVLITCHKHPDPDALGSAAALTYLLRTVLPAAGRNPDVQIDMSVPGDIGGGVNAAFTKHAKFEIADWSDDRLTDPDRDDAYDAVVLCDVQPTFPYCPLPQQTNITTGGEFPTAVIDHHRSRGRKRKLPFSDIRTDVGATASIVFSYFAELDVPVPSHLSATLLYAIESDLAGAAGQPSDLDNAALASLTLTADTRRLYRMRNVALPQHYYMSFANALASATVFDDVLFAHLGTITNLEKPAVVADFLIRYEAATWAVVTATTGEDEDGKPTRMIFSARTCQGDLSAGEAMRRAMNRLGEGGGHRTKAGGFVDLENGSPTEIDRV
ncbi:MAG: DHH family phosphoesterase, partial [Planctomycetota bacterium]